MLQRRSWSSSMPADSETTVIAAEYWCFDEDPIWAERNEELIRIAKHELTKVGLIAAEDVLDGHVIRVNKCYPVYSLGYKQDLKVIEEYLKEIENLHVIGRYGAFKYHNQDHCMLMGILTAHAIISNDNMSRQPQHIELSSDEYFEEAGI